jgi:adhesin/invasin
VKTPAGYSGFWFFAPALYRGAANDSIRIVTPTTIAVNAGNNQTGILSSAVATKPSVRVTDATGTPVAGVTVTFAVASGGGTMTGPTAVTDSTGTATLGSWTLGSGAGSNTITATAAGLSGSPVVFTATGAAPFSIVSGNNQTAARTHPHPGDPNVLTANFGALSVQLLDGSGSPLVGSQVTFTVGSKPSGMACEVDLSANRPFTNANGIATLAAGFSSNPPAAVWAYYADGQCQVIATVGSSSVTFLLNVQP